MKASLKFREEQKPQLKAKLPLSILSFQFQSIISSGDTKDLSLTLGTCFDSGPSFRLSYRPKDGSNPCTFLIKTGIGRFGSPVDAPMTISARFDFPNYYSNPGFFLHFKPRFGDFMIRKCQKSDVSVFESIKNGGGGVFEDGSVEFVDKRNVGEITDLPLRSYVEEAVQGMEVGANTVLPIKNGAVLKLRWGVKFPQGFNDVNVLTAGIWPRRMMTPVLGLNKISIERVAKVDKKKQVDVGVGVGTMGDVVETCFTVKGQLEMMRLENAALEKAVADLRAEIGGKGKGKGHLGERKSLQNGGVSGGGGGRMFEGVDSVGKA